MSYSKEWTVRGPGVVVRKTTEPAATLLEYLKSVIVTSKAQWDKLGKEADKEAIGAGPYKLRKLVTDNYVQLDKDPTHPLMSPENPDELVFRIMKEPEQRVTALFNNEVQIAQIIPPQLGERGETREQTANPGRVANYLVERQRHKVGVPANQIKAIGTHEHGGVEQHIHSAHLRHDHTPDR